MKNYGSFAIALILSAYSLSSFASAKGTCDVIPVNGQFVVASNSDGTTIYLSPSGSNQVYASFEEATSWKNQVINQGLCISGKATASDVLVLASGRHYDVSAEAANFNNSISTNAKVNGLGAYTLSYNSVPRVNEFNASVYAELRADAAKRCDKLVQFTVASRTSTFAPTAKPSVETSLINVMDGYEPNAGACQFYCTFKISVDLRVGAAR